MQQREKILAGALGGIVALWLVGPMLDSTFLQPLRDADAQLSSERQAFAQLEEKELQLMRAQSRLKRWKEISLPADPDVAMRLYQEWLTDLTELSGWQAVKVTPGRRVPKGKTYSTVPVTLETDVTWEQLGRFQTLFGQADLLQRIAQLEVSSRSSGERVPLTVTITAEALSLTSGPKTNELTAISSLAGELGLEQGQLQIEDTSDFPKSAPFLLQVGAELVKVSNVVGNRWTIERGIWQTSPRKHAAGTSVVLFPADDVNGEAMASLQRFSVSEFFAKPQPEKSYVPKLVAGSPPPAYFEKPWSFSVKVQGWNPEWDDPAYALAGDVPEGLEINGLTGELSWTPPAMEDPYTREFSVAVMSIWDERPKLTQSFTVKARRSNLPPVLDVPETLPVYLGRPAEFDLAGRNPEGEDDQLTYTLEGALPAGASFDARSGLLTWKPPLEAVPGEMELTVRVTDNGEPPLSASQTVKLTIADDVALYTYLTGIVDVSGRQQAWLRDRTTNRRTVVGVGDEFRFADVAGTVREMGYDYVVIERADGRYQLRTGQNLRQLEPLPKRPVPENPATEPPSPAMPEAVPASR